MSSRDLNSPSSMGKEKSSGACLQPKENGLVDSLNSLDSEKVVQEFLQHPVDDHLFEFSEALRTVAKALRRVAEGKASAQAEAAEWKRKYELERAHNQKKYQEILCEGGNSDSKDERLMNLNNQSVLHGADSEQTERCCGKHDICSHEVLWNESTDSDPNADGDMVTRKASFKLSWGCNGSGQHKHDVVSFERGNITTAMRSSKQISLSWETCPQTVLILTKPNSTSVRVLCAEMVRWLKDEKRINVFVEPRVRTELLSESGYFNYVKTWAQDAEIGILHTKVDLVVTLGGDGTVLWCFSAHCLEMVLPFDSCVQAASMFKGPVPPVVPFSLGSLGFMTPFQSEHYREYLNAVLKGPVSITLRHRLQCHVICDAAKDEMETQDPILVLNEVTIDRGMSSYLTNLECYCDSSFVTCVQGDGLILSTTSGSTAYSLAAGGSMVHPQVPGILFTPICPHSLSFRPLILPEYVTLRVQVPFNSRGHAWASFDGKDRKQLSPGDALICSMAPWPVPTACQVDATNDFLHSIHEGLHWNVRKSQSFDGPRD